MNYNFSENVAGLKASAIREILKFTSDPEVISFAAGNPAPEAFPIETIAEISAQLLRDDPLLALQYSITEGYTPLRDALKRRMESLGCYSQERDELIVTSGAQQAIELACKVFCNRGDTLICEAPSFIGSLNSFRSYAVNLVGVETETDGINLEKLEEALKTKKNVKLIYLIPNFQNPTGRTMSFEKRRRVYELACRYGAVIIEDNPYGDLRFDGEDIPSIKTLDTENRVIYVGSFSKLLAPGLRVGYVSAPKEIIQKIVVCKQVSDVHTNIWAQAICARFLETVDLDKHISHLHTIYKKKYDLMAGCLAKDFPSSIIFDKAQGGLFIWATLPAGSDMMGFCTKAVRDCKVAIVPGTAFTIKESDPTTSFRLNFSTPTDELIVEGCKRLGALAATLFGG